MTKSKGTASRKRDLSKECGGDKSKKRDVSTGGDKSKKRDVSTGGDKSKKRDMSTCGGDRSKRNKTRKMSDGNSHAHTVRVMLEMLNMVKLYHWKTRSYAQHKATDQLYENLNKNIDKIVEVLIGKENTRIKMSDKKMDLIDSSNTQDFKGRIYKYREFLLDLNNVFDAKRDSDLLSIRDDILVDIDQFLYLMTFDRY